ncbi:MAG TPA: methyltransferase dimerization domain-containing protein [Blastocatellia bacterium]|nr:methyltransferase dimerization domain-containing protein [Blastocatellia bacterium]
MSEQSVALKMEDAPPQMVAMQLMTGYWVSQMVYVAARLKLADLLADGPKTSEQLAKASGVHAETLNRLLRALVSVGMFSTNAEGRYTLTPVSELFRSGPGSMSPMVIHTLETPSWQAWGELLESVKTGKTGFLIAHGQEVFPYYATHPESAEPFNEAMTGYSAMVSS